MDIMAIVSIVLFSVLTLVFIGLMKFYWVVDQRKPALAAIGFALVSLLMSYLPIIACIIKDEYVLMAIYWFLRIFIGNILVKTRPEKLFVSRIETAEQIYDGFRIFEKSFNKHKKMAGDVKIAIDKKIDEGKEDGIDNLTTAYNAMNLRVQEQEKIRQKYLTLKETFKREVGY